jgi:hypothetical protein
MKRIRYNFAALTFVGRDAWSLILHGQFHEAASAGDHLIFCRN